MRQQQQQQLLLPAHSLDDKFPTQSKACDENTEFHTELANRRANQTATTTARLGRKPQPSWLDKERDTSRKQQNLKMKQSKQTKTAPRGMSRNNSTNGNTNSAAAARNESRESAGHPSLPRLASSSYSPATSTTTARRLSRISQKHQASDKRRNQLIEWPMKLVDNLNTNLLAIILLTFLIPVAESVDCFKCSSRNGSNPACEDPFHNLNSTRVTSPIVPDPVPNVIYHTPCYAGKKGREGLFPASACIKLTGTFDTTGETLVVRHCALDSGTLTQDTELARMSHCGKFQFDGDLLKGCVLACPEDACNSAPKLTHLDYNKTVMPYLILLVNLGVVWTTMGLVRQHCN